MTGACEVRSPCRPLYEGDEKLLRESSALGPSIGRAFLVLALSVEVAMNDYPVLYPKWQPQLKAATNETDPTKRLQRILEVEGVLWRRLNRILGSRSHRAEVHAIEDAMDDLEALKRITSQSRAS